MKLTAKMMPIDQRRRRALERAHAQEIMAARAALDVHAQQLLSRKYMRPRLRVAMSALPPDDYEGEML